MTTDSDLSAQDLETISIAKDLLAQLRTFHDQAARINLALNSLVGDQTINGVRPEIMPVLDYFGQWLNHFEGVLLACEREFQRGSLHGVSPLEVRSRFRFDFDPFASQAITVAEIFVQIGHSGTDIPEFLALSANLAELGAAVRARLHVAPSTKE